MMVCEGDVLNLNILNTFRGGPVGGVKWYPEKIEI